jgi:hypothetical protein
MLPDYYDVDRITFTWPPFVPAEVYREAARLIETKRAGASTKALRTNAEQSRIRAARAPAGGVCWAL